MSFKAWTPDGGFWEPEQAFEGYGDWVSDLIGTGLPGATGPTGPGVSAALVPPKTPNQVNAALISTQHYEIPWMEQELISGFENKWLVYGGAVVAIAGAGLWFASRKK